MRVHGVRERQPLPQYPQGQACAVFRPWDATFTPIPFAGACGNCAAPRGDHGRPPRPPPHVGAVLDGGQSSLLFVELTSRSR
jgi:hypothetical protein